MTALKDYLTVIIIKYINLLGVPHQSGVQGKMPQLPPCQWPCMYLHTSLCFAAASLAASYYISVNENVYYDICWLLWLYHLEASVHTLHLVIDEFSWLQLLDCQYQIHQKSQHTSVKTIKMFM